MLKAILVFFLALTAAFAAESNATNGGCSTCGSPSYTDISYWCSQYSGWSQSCCQCIAQAESGGDLHACNLNSDGSIDVGLWQVNSFNWPSCNGGNAPCDGDSNLHCSKMVFGWGGNTWKYWATCGKCGCCGRA